MDIEHHRPQKVGVKQKNLIQWTVLDAVEENVTSYVTAMSSGTYQLRVQAFSEILGETGFSNQIQVKVETSSSGGGKGGGPKK